MFRRKSEDPWDRKPEKRPNLREISPQDPPDSEGPWTPPEREEEGWNPGKRLDDWLEKRRAAAAERAAPDLPPEKCPWCGQDMTQGYIYGRGAPLWNPGTFITGLFVSIPDDKGTLHLSEDGLYSYKIAWRCKDCKKIIIDTADCEITKPYSGPFTEPEEKEEPEENGT